MDPGISLLLWNPVAGWRRSGCRTSTRSQEVTLVTVDDGRVEVVRPGLSPADAQMTVSVPEVTRIDSGGGEVTVLFYPAVGVTGAVARGCRDPGRHGGPSRR
jgi:hypothetical protein